MVFLLGNVPPTLMLVLTKRLQALQAVFSNESVDGNCPNTWYNGEAPNNNENCSFTLTLNFLWSYKKKKKGKRTRKKIKKTLNHYIFSQVISPANILRSFLLNHGSDFFSEHSFCLTLLHYPNPKDLSPKTWRP